MPRKMKMLWEHIPYIPYIPYIPLQKASCKHNRFLPAKHQSFKLATLWCRSSVFIRVFLASNMPLAGFWLYN
jgi:hypothetical protein